MHISHKSPSGLTAWALLGAILIAVCAFGAEDDKKDEDKDKDKITADSSGMLQSRDKNADKEDEKDSKTAWRSNVEDKRDSSGLLRSDSKLIREKKEKERYLIRVLIQLGADRPEEEPSKRQHEEILWKDIKSKHFIIYYAAAQRGASSDAMAKLEDEESYARKAARNAERYYYAIAKTLGYQRRTDFWTWDNRVKIFIYPSNPAYLKDSDRPKWSRGMTDYAGRKIIGYHTWREDEFLEEILPHELAHMIFQIGRAHV